jgi:hypothetical protein
MSGDNLMALRINHEFNLLPSRPNASTTLAAVVREQNGGSRCKMLVCASPHYLPGSLAGIGMIAMKSNVADDLVGNRPFTVEVCEKILGSKRHEFSSNAEFALREIIRNAVIHGNKRDPDKKVLISFRQAPKGVILDVYDEGKGSLTLFNSSWGLRELATWFRLGYGGQNCGLLAIARYFGQENLSATKVYDQTGRRVGTRVSLFVKAV